MSHNEYRKRLIAARTPFDAAREAWATQRTSENWQTLREAEAMYRQRAEELFEQFCAETF